MALNIPERTFDNFESLTRYRLRRNFLARFANFISVHRQNIVDYYGGNVSKPFAPSFTELDYLVNQSAIIKGLVEANKASLANTENWELIELLTSVHRHIKTIEESSRWLRSAIRKGDFNQSATLDYILPMLTTLQQVADNVVQSNDPQNSWIDIAISNDLMETDYDSDGGNTLQLSFSNKKSINITAVVDNIDSAEKVKGLDIQRKYEYVDDDLKVLDYNNTFIQAVEILAGLKQGDHPFYPEHGINSGVVIGSNRSFVSFPVLARNQFEAFATDDTIRRFRNTEMDFDKTGLRISLEVQDRTGEFQSVTTFI